MSEIIIKKKKLDIPPPDVRVLMHESLDRLNRSVVDVHAMHKETLKEIRELTGASNKEGASTNTSIRGMISSFDNLSKNIKDLTAIFYYGMKEIPASLVKGGKEGHELSVPLFKSMINAISEVGTEVKNKPVPVWRWPQYASVGVRDKNFANINPAIDERAGTLGNGTKTVTSAGSAVRITATSTPIYRVIVQAHESNTGTVVLGDSTVVAALSGRKGLALYPTQSQEFKISDLNLLYVDSTASSDKINYYYETA